MRTVRGQDGYISVAVLMIAGLLAALVAATIQVSRPTAGYARLNVDDLQADALLQAGVSAAAYALFAARREPGQVSGLVVPFETGAVRLSAASEAGRIDLNGAPPQLLAGIYREIGGTAMTPEQFAGRVVDWRDRDNRPARAGAERPDYVGAGLGYGPRNAPFTSVEELLLVLGMTRPEYDRLAPYITVFNPEGMIDPLSAPLRVLAAVPRLDARQAEALVSALRSESPERRERNRLLQTYREFLSIGERHVFRVGVEARLLGGFSKSVEAVIMQTGDADLFDVLAWIETSGDQPR